MTTLFESDADCTVASTGRAEPTVRPLSQSVNPLIAACAQGDPRSMELFYKKYFPALYPVAARYARDDLETKDILNTAMFKIFKALPDFEPERSFMGWLKTIVIRTGLDIVRARLRQPAGAELSHAEHVFLDEPTDDGLHREDILALLRRLPEMSRTVLVMFAIEGYSHREIGEALGITENNSRWHLHAARQQFKNLLEKNEP